MGLIISCITQNYGNFSGRAKRVEFWLFWLFWIAAYSVSFMFDYGAGLYNERLDMGLTSTILSFALLVPSLAVGARRLHDIDRTGWWQLVALVPVVGAIVLIVFWCLRGTDGDNRFGSDPLAA